MLLGRGRAPPVSDISASQIHRYLDEKVAGVGSETANAPPPLYRLVYDVSFLQFQQVSREEVAAVIHALPEKSCVLDLLLTTQLKAVADVVVPFLTELLNRSPSNGSVPDVFKEYSVVPSDFQFVSHNKDTGANCSQAAVEPSGHVSAATAASVCLSFKTLDGDSPCESSVGHPARDRRW